MRTKLDRVVTRGSRRAVEEQKIDRRAAAINEKNKKNDNDRKLKQHESTDETVERWRDGW